MVHDKDDVECETIDVERENEEPGEVVEVVMVCTLSTPCVDDGGAGDINNNNNNPEGTRRTTPGVIGTRW